MTEAELFQAIKAEALKTTIGPYEFLRKVDNTEGYDWTKAHWFTLMKYADKLKTLPAPVPPPLPSLAGMAQNVMFTAWNPHAGLRASVPKWKLAVTADIHVTCSPEDSPQVRAVKAAAYIEQAQLAVKQQHDRGGIAACWGNQEQLPSGEIQRVGALLGVDYLIFQAETEAECASALNAVIAGTTKVIIGNPNAWTQVQRDNMTTRITNGYVAFIFEVYTNEGAPWPDQASSQGVPAAAESLGVGWGANPSYQLSSYKPHTSPAVWAGISPYLAEGFNEESWGLLP